MADARLLKCGGDDPDFTLWPGKLVGDILQNLEAGCVDAIVVGDENTHILPRLPVSSCIQSGTQTGKRA